MTLLFIDSFDHYNIPADCSKKWTSQASTGVASTVGRNGTALRSTGSYGWVLKGFNQRDVLTCGFAFRCASTLTAMIMEFWDPGYCQLGLALLASGAMELRAYSSHPGTGASTLLDTTPALITAGNWYYIECKAFLDNTNGYFEVYVDGTLAKRYDGDTLRAPSSPYTRLAGVALGPAQSFNGYTNNKTFDYDDLYIVDSLGVDNNTYLGDCRIACLYPNGEGATQEWTPQGGGDHYDEVKETLLDSDTTYETSTAYPEKTLYTFDDLTGSVGAIAGIQTSAAVRKTQTGGAIHAHTVRSNATDTDGDDKAFSGGTAYQYSIQVWEKDPSDSLDWTEAKVNAVQAGVNRTA